MAERAARLVDRVFPVGRDTQLQRTDPSEGDYGAKSAVQLSTQVIGAAAASSTCVMTVGHLERHVPVELRVAGAQHDTHTAGTELAGDFVRSQSIAGAQRHVNRTARQGESLAAPVTSS